MHIYMHIYTYIMWLIISRDRSYTTEEYCISFKLHHQCRSVNIKTLRMPHIIMLQLICVLMSFWLPLVSSTSAQICAIFIFPKDGFLGQHCGKLVVGKLQLVEWVTEGELLYVIGYQIHAWHPFLNLADRFMKR